MILRTSQTRCRVGTRKSLLATTQSQWVANRLEASGLACELVEIVSEGDVDQTKPLYAMEAASPGLFCKQLEQALLEGRIDIAVHSLKDLPTLQPEGLVLLAVPERENPQDVLLIHPECVDPSEVLGIRKGARVGTSSLRRQALLLEQRPDLRVGPLRGNVPSRLEQVRTKRWDGAVLARAGLSRLRADLSGLVAVDLPLDLFVSAPGQGALAVEGRNDLPAEWLNRVQALNHAPTRTDVRIERRVLRQLEGGCTLPLGVYCRQVQGPDRRVVGFLGVREQNQAMPEDPSLAWLGFHRFDISGPDEDTLVAKMVEYFEPRKAQKGPSR